MPYIEEERRNELIDDDPKTAGELNYKITEQCIEYMDAKGKSYKTINEIIGVLECAKMEFYRRVGVPYEYTKMILNGDVYK